MVTGGNKELGDSKVSRLDLSPRRILSGAAFGALLILCLWTPIQMAQAASAVVPVVHLDGAYQTLNGLLRLGSGQLPGRDFFPYLGIGPLATLWPVYSLLGSTVASSVFAATLMTTLALQASFAITAVVVFRTRSWLFTLTAALVPVVVVHMASGLLPHLATVLNIGTLVELSSPGNSLRPIRAFAPFLLVFLVLVITSRKTRAIHRAVFLGISAGAVAAVWSNDYALASASLMLVMLTVGAWLKLPRWRVTELVCLWVTSASTFVVAGMTITGGNFLRLLGYNLVDVRGDQYWYFGPWSRVYRINSPIDLFWTMNAENAIWPLAMLAILTCIALCRRDRWLGLLTYLGGALLLGGVAATVGGHAGGYFSPFKLWGVMTLALLVAYTVVRVWLRLQIRLPVLSKTSYTRLPRIAVPLIIVLAAIAIAAAATSSRVSGDSRLAADSAFIFDEELGGYLDRRFVTHLQQVPDSTDQLLEEYSGMLTATIGPRRDTEVDSVIHALGRQRVEYQEVIQGRPGTVVTSSIDVGEWVTWNLSANWWFYRDLFKGYEPQQSSPTTYIWHPSAVRAWPSTPCKVEENEARVSTSHKGLYEVVVNYQGPGRGTERSR